MDLTVDPNNLSIVDSNDILLESVGVLNSSTALNNLKDPTKKLSLLKLHRFNLHKKNSGVRILKQYIVGVFQTETAFIYHSNLSKELLLNYNLQNLNFEPLPQDKIFTAEVRRVKTNCIRAVYALGLDYAIVKCGVIKGGKVVILNVRLGIKVNNYMKEKFISIYHNHLMKQSKLTYENLLLGADPEFIMKKNGKLLLSSNYFSMSGLVGCDDIWIGKNRLNKPIVEIRPSPTQDPIELTKRIKEGLIKAKERMNIVSKNIIFCAGAVPYPNFPIGGHIHFSGIPPSFRVLRVLDNYLALLLLLIESPISKSRREKYGFLGDFRNQPHGGFEYRVLPSWLVSENLTCSVLCLAKLLVINHQDIDQFPLDDITIQEAYYKGDKAIIYGYLKFLKRVIQRLKYYDNYDKYISYLFNNIDAGLTWDDEQDIIVNWDIK